MVLKPRAFAAAIVLAVLAVGRADCQAPAMLGQPLAAAPTPSHYMPLPAQAPCNAPAAEACNPYQDSNGKLLVGDPLLDDKTSSPLGWFGAAEIDIVDPHIKNRLVNTVGGDVVHLPGAALDWAVSPRFELGYRFGQGVGDLVTSYKFLETTGNEALPGFDPAGGTAALHSRLNINEWDIDYGNWENSLLPDTELRWRLGVRLGANFFDSQASSPLLEQRESNYYFGAGPHVGVDVRHEVGDSGVSLVGRMEAAFLIGQSWESAGEVFPGPVGAATRSSLVQTVPVLSVQAGLEWIPKDNDHWHFSGGYTYERWWDYAGPQGSQSDMFMQGFFLRGEFRY